MVVKDQNRGPDCSHRPCRRCHYRLVVWKSYSVHSQVSSSSLVTSSEPMKIERTHFYHTHIPLGRTNSLSDHNLKSLGWWSLKVASGETRRLVSGHWLHASHVVRRLIKMIGQCAPGQYWQRDSTELVSTIINWKLFSTQLLSDVPRIHHNTNKKEKFQ